MPPPTLDRRMSAPRLIGRIPSMASPTAGSSSGAPPPPPPPVASSPHAGASNTVPPLPAAPLPRADSFSIVSTNDEVRPPSRVPSQNAMMPAAAPAKVLVKRRKQSFSSQNSDGDVQSPRLDHESDPVMSQPQQQQPLPLPASSFNPSATASERSSSRQSAIRPQPTAVEVQEVVPVEVNTDQRWSHSMIPPLSTQSQHSRTASTSARSDHESLSTTQQTTEMAQLIAQFQQRSGSAASAQAAATSRLRDGGEEASDVTAPPANKSGKSMPPPPPPLPPPPKRVSQFIVDEAPLPSSVAVKTRVEEAAAAERIRLEIERSQQPRFYSFRTQGTNSAMDTPRDNNSSGNYFKEETPVNNAPASVGEEGSEDRRAGGVADFAQAVSEAARRMNSMRDEPKLQTSPSARYEPGSPKPFALPGAITFSIEFGGVSVTLLEQLSSTVQDSIVDAITRTIFDAVRGPIAKVEHVRIEHITPSEDDDHERTIVEGTIRGAKTHADRRLAIRLLSSYIRGPTQANFGENLSRFSSLVRDAGQVTVRRLYINDVDVPLIVSLALGGNHQSPSTQAIFEQRSKRGVTTPTLTAPEGSGLPPKPVSPTRYPDRAIYHHISSPINAPPLPSNATPLASARVQHSDPLAMELSVLHSPSNSYGVTRYRTRCYEQY